MKFRETPGYEDKVLQAVWDVCVERPLDDPRGGRAIVSHPNLGDLELIGWSGGRGLFPSMDVCDNGFGDSLTLRMNRIAGEVDRRVASFSSELSGPAGWENTHRQSFVQREGIGWFVMDVMENIVARSRDEVLRFWLGCTQFELQDGGKAVFAHQEDTLDMLRKRGYLPRTQKDADCLELCLRGVEQGGGGWDIKDFVDKNAWGPGFYLEKKCEI